MFCSRCGKEILEGDDFCGNCGAAVSEKAQWAEQAGQSLGQLPPQVPDKKAGKK